VGQGQALIQESLYLPETNASQHFLARGQSFTKKYPMGFCCANAC